MVNKIADNLKSVTGAIIILLFVGALSGTWLISGIIPSMIYYGLNILHPSIFLPSCLIHDSKKPYILLNSHHDTVKPTSGYTLNPFDSIIKEKKLYEDLINSFETSIQKLKDLDDLSELALEKNLI